MEQQSQSVIPGLSLTEALDRRRNEVWHAVDHENDRSVAVKLLNPAYEPIVPRRFGQRARILTKVLRTTQGWVPLLGHGVARDGRQYVMAPYFRSGSMADQLVHGSTPWYPATSLLVRVATTIGGAQSGGWSFGRLRPSNVLFKSAGHPLVSTYGSSTRRFDDGTAQFTAPEVASGQEPVPASDVFSLALILASLIAGREIDCSERVTSVLSEIAGRAPERIVEIIDYGLSPSLQNRYADATKMARAMAAALEHPRDNGESTAADVEADGAEDQTINPLEALLAEPLVAPQDQPSGVGFSSTSTGDADTEPPWIESEDDTGPIDLGPQLDDPTANPFTTGHGPLSDLLGPVGPPLSMIDPFDSDPTIDDLDATEARNEINQLINQLGLDGDSGDTEFGTTDHHITIDLSDDNEHDIPESEQPDPPAGHRSQSHPTTS